MKNLFIILCILLISSCQTKYRTIFKPKFDKDKVDSTLTDTTNLDTLSSNGDGVPDYIDYDDTIVVKNVGVGVSNNNPKVIKTNNRKPSSVGEVEMVDNTDSTKTSEGIIAYSVPTDMIVGQKYNVKVRITKDRSGKSVLVVGDRNIPINDASVDSKITIEDIRVEKTMTADLVCDTTSFSIQSLSSKVQNIEDKGYTEWAWLVTPLKSGKGYLKLIVKVRIDENVQKDIVVFDKNIEVKPDRVYSVRTWFGKYWQWLISTIIIPFIIWLYKRRKKEKEEED